MAREKVLREFRVMNSIIVNPGKFEGEPLYVPHYWEMGMMGMADEDNGREFTFNLTSEDLADFPELGKAKTLVLSESESGFVYSTLQ